MKFGIWILKRLILSVDVIYFAKTFSFINLHSAQCSNAVLEFIWCGWIISRKKKQMKSNVKLQSLTPKEPTKKIFQHLPQSDPSTKYYRIICLLYILACVICIGIQHSCTTFFLLFFLDFVFPFSPSAS